MLLLPTPAEVQAPEPDSVSEKKSHLKAACSSYKKSLEHSVDDTEFNLTLISHIAVYLDLLTQNLVLLTSTSALLFMITYPGTTFYSCIQLILYGFILLLISKRM